MARPAMGVRWGGEACAAAEPAAGRREQEVPPALLWAAGARRPEVEEALRLLDGHRMVTGARLKLTKASVPANLVGPLYWVPATRGSIHFFV